MGFRKDWDISEISQNIYRMHRECSSPYNDGYTAFEIKKELYEIKFIIDQVLKNSPTFSGEDEWLTEQEKKRIIKHLKS
jgi:hypothetical protein